MRPVPERGSASLRNPSTVQIFEMTTEMTDHLNDANPDNAVERHLHEENEPETNKATGFENYPVDVAAAIRKAQLGEHAPALAHTLYRLLQKHVELLESDGRGGWSQEEDELIQSVIRVLSESGWTEHDGSIPQTPLIDGPQAARQEEEFSAQQSTQEDRMPGSWTA